MSGLDSAAAGAVWARGEGVVLRLASGATAEVFETPAIRRALLDAVERGYDGEPEPIAPDALRLVVEVAGVAVGVLGVERGRPELDATAVTTLAIAAGKRGHAYAARALLVAERRLVREGTRSLWLRVPRGNGRGLYFALRCGYAPVTPPPVQDGASWLRRNPELAPRVASPRTALSRQARAAR